MRSMKKLPCSVQSSGFTLTSRGQGLVAFCSVRATVEATPMVKTARAASFFNSGRENRAPEPSITKRFLDKSLIFNEALFQIRPGFCAAQNFREVMTIRPITQQVLLKLWRNREVWRSSPDIPAAGSRF